MLSRQDLRIFFSAPACQFGNKALWDKQQNNSLYRFIPLPVIVLLSVFRSGFGVFIARD
jgi:hypothetical protein